MMASEPELGKFGITARLFKLVSEMPKDQQLILLQQLAGDRVRTHLCKLIVEMSEEQQIILLEQMGQPREVPLPVKTVSSKETEASMRENPRKPSLINANYRVQGRNLKSYILDISVGGVFIETDVRFPVGEQLLLKFSLPNQSRSFTFEGKIAWSSAKGFGVKFENVTAHQSDILKSFVEQKD